ncbi:hypothetical protein V1525DRAFT_403650 [Lipomyces kononenkoae]|uniref:Uncharacterized protein n=1 Tax=Lipomyces kononenkoae TaxID=34357 RepID=A0ACC3T235_LIPKO
MACSLQIFAILFQSTTMVTIFARLYLIISFYVAGAIKNVAAVVVCLCLTPMFLRNIRPYASTRGATNDHVNLSTAIDLRS